VEMAVAILRHCINYHYFSGKTKENHKKTSVKITGLHAKSRSRDLTDTTQECQPFNCDVR
jgi:hypothetical protein